ncbi:cytochrome C biogenesis protein ResB [Desulforamulus ferrireducens]|uniref:Cytochrome C biogenesis protein ResB n=2 Tax=Desulforamulus ferrireducens TaxID=1833852 RepID=A0A1S6J0E6_9FIRM|nr:cytochrome C biogenesis protein ResB [Desulforamulus ferrireducens]
MSLGLVLLCLIIVLSIIGTLHVGIFKSPWFLAASGLLTANLLVCTCGRLKTLLKSRGVPGVLQQEGKHRFIALDNLTPEQVAQEASAELSRLGFRVKRQNTGQGTILSGSKGGWAAFGSPLLHLAMVFVIAGSVIGGIWGQENYYEVEVPGKALLTQDGYPFDLNIKKFHIDTYEDGSAKQYTSTVEVLSANEKLLEKAVSVNRPLHYQGVKVYQTAYGYHLQGAVRDVNRSFDFAVEEGDRIFLGGSAHLELAVQWPRYFIFSNGVPFTMGIAELGEPIQILDKEIVFTNRTTYTGLQVKKDPGLPLVYAGFVLFLIALPMRLYVRPKQIWLLLTASTAGTEVRLAARHRIKDKEQEELLLEKLSGINRKESALQT